MSAAKVSVRERGGTVTRRKMVRELRTVHAKAREAEPGLPPLPEDVLKHGTKADLLRLARALYHALGGDMGALPRAD